MSADDELSRRISRALDSSIENMDQATLEQLQAARRQALKAGKAQRTWKYVSLAAAAGLMTVALFPWLSREPMVAPDNSEQMVMYLDVDPGMLENLDMLQVIGEDADAT